MPHAAPSDGECSLSERFAIAERPVLTCGGCEADPAAAVPIHFVRRPGAGVTSAFGSRGLLREPKLPPAALQVAELSVDLRAWIDERAEPTAERAT